MVGDDHLEKLMVVYERISDRTALENRLHQSANVSEIAIYTIDSKLMYKKNAVGGSVVEVNTSSFAPGIYLVKIKSGFDVEVKKVVIKR